LPFSHPPHLYLGFTNPFLRSDGNIRYFEYEADALHPLSEHKSSDPQRGMCFLPRRALNVGECEIARAYKVTTGGPGGGGTVEPIAFIVPRKVRFRLGPLVRCFLGCAVFLWMWVWVRWRPWRAGRRGLLRLGWVSRGRGVQWGYAFWTSLQAPVCGDGRRDAGCHNVDAGAWHRSIPARA
jgi:hypothetical protein